MIRDKAITTLLNGLVPAPGVAVAAVQPVTPYNGTAFSLMGTMQLDESVIDVDVVATWEWSLRGRTLRHERTSSVLHPTVLTFQPLATNSSGEYSLNLTLAPLNRSDFILESRARTMYSLNVLRKYIILEYPCIEAGAYTMLLGIFIPQHYQIDHPPYLSHHVTLPPVMSAGKRWH